MKMHDSGKFEYSVGDFINIEDQGEQASPDPYDNEPDIDENLPFSKDPTSEELIKQQEQANDVLIQKEEGGGQEAIISQEMSLKALNFIEFKDEQDGRKDIIDCSKLIIEQNRLYSEIVSEITSRLNYSELNDADKGIYKALAEKLKIYNDLSQSFIAFFKFPPTKDEFEKINHVGIMRKALNDFRIFSDNLENLHLKEQSEGFSQEFSNFIASNKAKLESLIYEYDSFLKSFIDKQKKHIEPFEAQFDSILKNYDKSFTKVLKIAKGGAITLLLTNIILVFVFGALSAAIYFQKEEISDIANINNTFEEIKVLQDKNRLIFEFDKSKTKVFDEGGLKKVIVETQNRKDKQ